jgi:hypothetical protein
MSDPSFKNGCGGQIDPYEPSARQTLAETIPQNLFQLTTPLKPQYLIVIYKCNKASKKY